MELTRAGRGGDVEGTSTGTTGGQEAESLDLCLSGNSVTDLADGAEGELAVAGAVVTKCLIFKAALINDKQSLWGSIGLK